MSREELENALVVAVASFAAGFEVVDLVLELLGH